MRRRAKRDLSIIVALVFILGAVTFVNYAYTRSDLADRMDALRREIEHERLAEGLDVLRWNLLRTTSGTARSGPTFTNELLDRDGDQVHIVGFMQPLNQFRDMEEFMILPLPIECYFCQIPPMRDVMLVQMKPGSTTQLYQEPVLLNGILQLNEGAGTKFFYTLSDAELGPGKAGTQLQQRYMDPEHMIPNHESTSELVEGVEPPVPLDDL